MKRFLLVSAALLFRRILPTAAIFILFSRCNHSTPLDHSKITHSSPASIIKSLQGGYNEKKLNLYLSCFDPNSMFTNGASYSWDLQEESRIHSNMFATAKSIVIELNEDLNVSAYAADTIRTYMYKVIIELPTNKSLEANGRIEIEFANYDSLGWLITSMNDTKTGFSKALSSEVKQLAINDSLDYFPLRVGNRWIYKEQNFMTTPIQASVIDSIVIGGNLYYGMDNFIFPVWGEKSYVRIDSLQQLKMLVTPDSSEITIFKFAAAVSETWQYQIPGEATPVEVTLLKVDSSSVPAGIFSNVLFFQSIFPPHVFIDEFAPDIGRIRFQGENSNLFLQSAHINGKDYPIKTSVETDDLSWTKLKLAFRP